MLKSLLKVLVLVVGLMAVTGCGGHYVLDNKYIDPSQIVSSNEPDAIKVYVGEYRFNDKRGSPICLNCSRAEGEMAPWIKRAVKEYLKNIYFTDKKQDASIVIETTKISFDADWTSAASNGYFTVNGNPLRIKVNSRSGGDFIAREPHFKNAVESISILLARAIKDSLTVAGGSINITNFPTYIHAWFKIKDDNTPKIYDVEIER
jgi:hypothetical protein